MKTISDFEYSGMGQLYIDKKLRTHNSCSVDFEYPEGKFFEDRCQKQYTVDDVSYLLNELLQLKMQDFYILQQKAYHPEISYSKIAEELGVSRQAIHQRINRMKNDAIFCFICRDFTYNEASKNSFKNII
jgi:hypothetical protein